MWSYQAQIIWSRHCIQLTFVELARAFNICDNGIHLLWMCIELQQFVNWVWNFIELPASSSTGCTHTVFLILKSMRADDIYFVKWIWWFFWIQNSNITNSSNIFWLYSYRMLELNRSLIHFKRLGSSIEVSIIFFFHI